MANKPISTPRKKKPVKGPSKGPSRAKKAPVKRDPFAGIAELEKHDTGRRKIFRGR